MSVTGSNLPLILRNMIKRLPFNGGTFNLCFLSDSDKHGTGGLESHWWAVEGRSVCVFVRVKLISHCLLTVIVLATVFILSFSFLFFFLHWRQSPPRNFGNFTYFWNKPSTLWTLPSPRGQEEIDDFWWLPSLLAAAAALKWEKDEDREEGDTLQTVRRSAHLI